MKKTLLYILAAICLFASSCSHESANGGRSVVFRLEMPDQDQIYWDNYSDCFHIFENGVEPQLVIVDFPDGNDDVIVHLVYPASSASTFKYTGFINGRSSKNPVVGTEQVYRGNRFDAKSDIMIIDPLVMYPDETESFLDLTRVVALNTVYVDGLASGEKITSVVVKSANDLSATYNFTSNNFGTGAKTLSLSGETAIIDGSTVFSFVSVPLTSSACTFEIVTSKKTYTIEKNVTVRKGLNSIVLDLSGGDTPGPGPDGPAGPDGVEAKWLELPAMPTDPDAFVGTFFGVSEYATHGKGSERNYTYYYDKGTYTCLWVAYPLYSSTVGGGRSGGWEYNPALETRYQVNLSSSYNVLYGETDYVDNADATGKEYYARGHQIPDADRSGHDVMQYQTYFYTNSTPQIQNAFNAGIWMQLESGVRDAIPSRDTLYVVTGAAFRTKGNSENITYIHPKRDPYKDVPVPNYYWKVLLKVNRSGSTVTSASAIGFWLRHEKNSGTNYSNYACSVDSIEEKLGFDFFENLPESVEASAESNTSWSSFKSFR